MYDERIVQLSPVNPGWRAVFTDDIGGHVKLTAIPLIGLALEEGRKYQRLTGLLCIGDEILAPQYADEYLEFVGYAAPGQDVEEFRARAEEKIRRAA